MPDNPLVWSIALVVLVLIVALLVGRARRSRASGGSAPVGQAQPRSGMPLAPPPATPPPAAPPAPAAVGPFIEQVPFAPAPETGEMPVVVGVGPPADSPAGADIRTGAAPFESDAEPAPAGERGSQFTWDWGQAAAVAQPAPPPTTAARPVVGADDISLDPSDVDEYVTPGVDPMDEALRQQAEPSPAPSPTSEPPRPAWSAPVFGGTKDTTSYAADAAIPADPGPSDDVAALLEGPQPAPMAEACAEPTAAVEVQELDDPLQRPDLDDAHRALSARDEDRQTGVADEQASERQQPQPADVAQPQPEGPPQVEVADGVMQAPQLLATPVLDDTEDLATWSALVAQHRAEGTYTPVRDRPAPEPQSESDSESESEPQSESESESEDGNATVSAAHEPEPDVEPQSPAPTAAASVRISELHEVMDGGYGWGSAAPIADGAMPIGHPVKANWHWMTFQAPGDPWYDRMTPDVWFVDAQTAHDHGFSRD